LIRPLLGKAWFHEPHFCDRTLALVVWLVFDCVQIVKSLCSLWYLLSLSLLNQGWPKTKQLQWKLKSQTRCNPASMIRKNNRYGNQLTLQNNLDFYTATGLFLEQFESIFKASGKRDTNFSTFSSFFTRRQKASQHFLSDGS